MNIIFCINALEGGGAEKVVLTLINGFLKNGHKVDLILVYKDEAYEIPTDINIHYLLSEKPKGIINKIFSIFKASILLKDIIKKISDKKDIDIFTSHLPLSNYISWIANIDNHYAVIHSAYSKKYKTKLKRFIIGKIHKNKQIITVSEGVKEDLINYFNLDSSKLRTIYNPFNIELIQKKSKEKIEYNHRYILHVGRLTKLKRHDLLIKAYSKSKLSDKYDLLLIGEGEEEKSIELLIKELKLENKIKLIGWQNNPYKWIKKANLLLLTSDYEGLPTVLIESLICNTPIVSVNCDYGPREILTKELSDFLVPVNNELELTKIMDKAILNYPKITLDMYDNFSLDNALHQYIKLIKG